MKFFKHSDLEGLHAFLGASKYHWLNYTPEKLVNTYNNFMAAQRGTELHEEYLLYSQAQHHHGLQYSF